ncbi:MAG: HAD family phosphatase [Clostridia bacterium]|nr:HAD family phosphatase [Clostridia bacterium]
MADVKISMIAMDLDGTLLGEDKRISEKNKAALRECAKRGIRVVLASGRSFESIRTFAKEIGIECGIISCNGARLDRTANGPIMAENCIPEATAVRLFDELRAANVYFECYTPGRIYMTDGFVERFHSHEARVLDLDGYRLEYIDGTERMRTEALKRAYKFVVFSPKKEELEAAAAKLDWPDVSVTSSWGDNIELMKRDAGKGRALTLYADDYGIVKEEIMAFGDQLNDMDLLRAAGWPVAMENAVDGLKEIARLIAPHHDCSGVGRVIEKWVL